FKKVKSFSRESKCLSRKAQATLAFELQEEGFKLKDVLKQVGRPESTYHYHVAQFSKADPDKRDETLITDLFNKHNGNYGYRRIHLALVKSGQKINHKKVQRIMRQLGLKSTKFSRRSRFNSYKGKVGKVAKNRLNRRF